LRKRFYKTVTQNCIAAKLFWKIQTQRSIFVYKFSRDYFNHQRNEKRSHSLPTSITPFPIFAYHLLLSPQLLLTPALFAFQHFRCREKTNHLVRNINREHDSNALFIKSLQASGAFSRKGIGARKTKNSLYIVVYFHFTAFGFYQEAFFVFEGFTEAQHTLSVPHC
jgi:hypothetical protein